MKTDSPHWIAIEGVPGAGKTTTARLIAGRLGAVAVPERSDLHPFLNEYYGDPQGLAMATELIFIALKLQAVGAQRNASAIVTDFTPAKDVVFAGLAMTPADLATISDLQNRVWVKEPNLTVFLRPPIEECRRRIIARGRGFESDLDEAQLERILSGYESHLDQLGERVVSINLAGSETRQEVADLVLAAVDQHQ